MNDPILRLAVWSGPRNVSTALMRSFEARGDTAVVDEPLYAHYLKVTGLEHPMRSEVLASQPNDWRDVVEQLLGPVPGAHRVFYQKHMAHHLTGEVDRSFVKDFTQVFLIREPRGMLASLSRKLGPVRLEDTGYPQQIELFRSVAASQGRAPAVVDARDLRNDPDRVLRALCDRIGLPFTEAMLNWAPGRRSTDGVWAAHWYDAVERSTGFAPFVETASELPTELESVAAQCQDLHDEMWTDRVR